MPNRGHHDNGPAATHAATQSNSVRAKVIPCPPPPYWTRSAHPAHGPRQRNYVDEERRPLLSSPPQKSKLDAIATLLILGIVIIWPIAYFAYSLVFVPSQVALYKNLYDDAQAQVAHYTNLYNDAQAEVVLYKNLYGDARAEVTLYKNLYDGAQAQVALYKDLYDDAQAQVNHLLKEKAILVSEVDNLKGQLNDAKVETFWEIARTLDTNMDVWVGADDPGAGPKFWAYGITNGKHNDPPVTTVQITFSVQGTVVESTDDRRVIGYRVKSDRQNNGWWMATGLNEFGEPGNHRLQFTAREGPPHNGATYEVVIYYAKWM